MFEAEIEIISFDASESDITKYYAGRKGKRIAWGIQSPEDIKDFRRGDLITPPCGMPHKSFTAEECKRRLLQLQRAAERYNS